MFTKKRAHYKKATKLKEHILKIRQTTYNDEFCHLCPNQLNNHKHDNSKCKITLAIHNRMILKNPQFN